MDTLANSEDPNEMQLKAAFHQVLQCLLRFEQYSVTEIHNNLEISTKQNWQSHTYCINMFVKIRQNTKINTCILPQNE